MTARRERRVRGWVAVLASYLTLFTVVFSGLGPSPVAARNLDPILLTCARDAFGHPLDKAPGHHHENDCCLAGCCTVGAVALAVPTASPKLPGRIIAIAATTPVGSGLDRRPPASPRWTRGPPRPV